MLAASAFVLYHVGTGDRTYFGDNVMAKLDRRSPSAGPGDNRPRGDDVVEIPGDTNYLFALFPHPATETRTERSERLYGTTLRHENTGPYRSSDPGHFYQEGPGRGKGKIVSSTSSPAGKFSMRHKYQAKIQNELRETYGARDSIGGSLRKSGHGVHEGDVSMNNPPEYR